MTSMADTVPLQARLETPGVPPHVVQRGVNRRGVRKSGHWTELGMRRTWRCMHRAPSSAVARPLGTARAFCSTTQVTFSMVRALYSMLRATRSMVQVAGSMVRAPGSPIRALCPMVRVTGSIIQAACSMARARHSKAHVTCLMIRALCAMTRVTGAMIHALCSTAPVTGSMVSALRASTRDRCSRPELPTRRLQPCARHAGRLMPGMPLKTRPVQLRA